ncbi:MAG: hypothetical protein FWF82_00580 [Oscillospiraceae bacterium]|nr:hypothetical protein [Oscillospiraceae bacterium]
MKTRKILSCVIAAAMMLCVIASMATVVGAASEYRLPTYNIKAGGWDVNDFRRAEGNVFNNDAGINLFETEKEFLSSTPAPNLQIILPEGKGFEAIKFLRVEFDFPADTDLEELNGMAIIMNNNIHGWQQHNVHISEPVNCNPAAKAVCNGSCKFDTSGAKPVILVPVDLEEDEYAACEFLKVTVTCDWAGDTETAGKATVTFLDKDKNTMVLGTWCDDCGGWCKEPCTDCGKNPCVCNAGGNGGTTAVSTAATTPPSTASSSDAPSATVTTNGEAITSPQTTNTADVAGTGDASDTTTSGPINPANTGVVFAIVPVILAGGAAVVASRKRK